MKNNIILGTLVALTMIMTTSCAAESDILDVEPSTKTASLVKAEFGSTRQGYVSTKSDNSYKANWNKGDEICIYSDNCNYAFQAISNDVVSSFASCYKMSDILSGTVTAVYPYFFLNEGNNGFSLNGQDGTFENLDKYFLMTANGFVAENGEVNLNFCEHITILKFNLQGLLFDDACLTSAELSGDGICNKLNINVNNDMLSVSAANNKNLKVALNNETEDGYYYIAFYNTGEDFMLHVQDDKDGDFFVNLSVNTLSNGCINEIPTEAFGGGYAIKFSADVEDWAGDVCCL